MALSRTKKQNTCLSTANRYALVSASESRRSSQGAAVGLQRCTFVGCADLGFTKSDASATTCAVCGWHAPREMEYLANTRSNWCSELPWLPATPLRSHWFGTRNNTGNRT